MDNFTEEHKVEPEDVHTYLDQCEELLKGYLSQLPDIEDLQAIIDLNQGLSIGYQAALDAMLAGSKVSKH